MQRTIAASLGVLLAALWLLTAEPGVGESQSVNINKASVAELSTINGIGPAKAQAIVEYREEHGGFTSVDDLTLVRGIGNKMLENLRPHVTVGDGASTSAQR